MRRLASSLAGAALALVPALGRSQDTTPEWANKSGVVGIGGNTTLGGSSGINVRTYLSPQFGLALTLGLDVSSSSVNEEDPIPDTDVHSTAFAIGLEASYKLAYWDRGHLSGFVGVDLRMASTKTETGPDIEVQDSTRDIGVAFGLLGEYFPSRYLSLFTQVGLSLDFIGEDETTTSAVDTVKDETSGLGVDLGGDLWGEAGFTVWFK